MKTPIPVIPKVSEETELTTDSAPKIDFAVGGQAVIEGVMMRSPDFITVAVKKMDGHIKVQEKPFTSYARRLKLHNIPLIRGIINMFEMMIVGTKALNFAAQEQIEDEEALEKSRKAAKAEGKALPKDPVQPDKLLKPSDVVKAESQADPNKSTTSKIFDALLFAGSMVFAFALSIFLFKFIPFWSATLFKENFSTVADNYFLFNVIDGILKVSIFILYIGLISFLPGLKRVFEYHGAEHKAIFTYEQGLPLEVEHARPQTRFHPRCGTSFILIVFIISILAYTAVPPAETFWSTFALRVAVLPLIAGISYEFLKWSAKKQNSPLMQLFIRPGLWLQRLTTREPDDTQLEVALVALKKALELQAAKSK